MYPFFILLKYGIDIFTSDIDFRYYLHREILRYMELEKKAQCENYRYLVSIHSRPSRNYVLFTEAMWKLNDWYTCGRNPLFFAYFKLSSDNGIPENTL